MPHAIAKPSIIFDGFQTDREMILTHVPDQAEEARANNSLPDIIIPRRFCETRAVVKLFTRWATGSQPAPISGPCCSAGDGRWLRNHEAWRTRAQTDVAAGVPDRLRQGRAERKTSPRLAVEIANFRIRSGAPPHTRGPYRRGVLRLPTA